MAFDLSSNDRQDGGSQLDVEALLRQAMGGPGFDGRFGDNSFSVPSAGTTPAPRTAVPMTPAEPQPPKWIFDVTSD